MGNQKPVIELELYLVRHGQSMGNVGFNNEEVTFTERNDPRLSELGIMQAKKAGKYLENVEFDACYCSPLVRTVITANEIMSFQKEKKPLNVLPLVTEVAVEEIYKGRTIEELRTFCDTAVVADGFNEADGLLFYNPRENEKPIFDRAVKAISYFRSRYKNGEKVLVAGHAAFNTVMIFHVMGFTASPIFDVEITNTGITHIIFYKEGTNKFGDIVFDSINDTKHFCIDDSEVLVNPLSSEKSSDIDEEAEKLAKHLKSIHSQKPDGIDIKPEMVEKTDEIKHFIPVEKWQKLRSLVTAVENSGTLLQLDGENQEKPYVGYPVFDLGKLYEKIAVTSDKKSEKFWERMMDFYFAGQNEQLISRAKDRAKLVAYFNIFYSLIKNENRSAKTFAFYKEKFIEYINRCGSLDFE